MGRCSEIESERAIERDNEISRALRYISGRQPGAGRFDIGETGCDDVGRIDIRFGTCREGAVVQRRTRM